MKLNRFLTSLIAGASLLTASNVTPVLAGGCDNAPPAGTVFKWTGPGTWKIMTTVRQTMSSNNERRLAYAYKKLDLQANRALAEFVNVKVAGAANLTESQKAEFVVGSDDEMSKDALEGFENFADEYGKSTEALLVGSIEIGRCHTLGQEVRLTRGINSENAVGAQMLGNQDFGGRTSGNNSTNSTSPTQTFRRDVNQGYSGYGNLDDF